MRTSLTLDELRCVVRGLSSDGPVGVRRIEEDALAAAAEYAEEHGLAAWEVTASWVGDEDGERDEIALRVPV